MRDKLLLPARDLTKTPEQTEIAELLTKKLNSKIQLAARKVQSVHAKFSFLDEFGCELFAPGS